MGLRGYGGRDPLVEFKREAYDLYGELREFIRHQVASTIFRVNVQRRAAAPQEPSTMPTLTPEQLAKLKTGPGAGAAGQQAAATASAGISSGGSATATSGAAVTTELIPGLQSQRPKNVQLQKGDQKVGAATTSRAAGQPPEAEKLGRNEPCWCGSGKKFKRCHGAS